MFNSSILDVAIGMIFVYLLLSLLCSAANEIVELWLKKRATDLERGIRELLIPDSASGANNDLVHQLYDHALINGLFKGKYADSGIAAVSRLARLWRYVKGTKLPAYIPSRNFALGLMDLILPGTAPAAPTAAVPAPPAPVASGATGATPATFAVSLAAAPPPPAAAIAGAGAVANPLQLLRAALGTNPLIASNPVAQKALIALVDAAGNDVAKARENIEAWYNNSMDRVSGWYKRRSQVFILVIGLFVAIAVNADSVTLPSDCQRTRPYAILLWLRLRPKRRKMHLRQPRLRSLRQKRPLNSPLRRLRQHRRCLQPVSRTRALLNANTKRVWLRFNRSVCQWAGIRVMTFSNNGLAGTGRVPVAGGTNSIGTGWVGY